jgi:hypothetical protein
MKRERRQVASSFGLPWATVMNAVFLQKAIALSPTAVPQILQGGHCYRVEWSEWSFQDDFNFDFP